MAESTAGSSQSWIIRAFRPETSTPHHERRPLSRPLELVDRGVEVLDGGGSKMATAECWR